MSAASAKASSVAEKSSPVGEKEVKVKKTGKEKGKDAKGKKDEKKEAKDGSKKTPIVCIVVGMAGTGKTTLMQRINSETHRKKIPSYIINLDPAVGKVPYSPNIDIRETVKYKEVMKQYKLGPNGGILTALNLFATRFGQVMGFLEKRADQIDYCFIDTPGQIEVFTWSASGQVITETLSSTFPTVIIYVVDTPRITSPVTFMSNMTYACSIMYKTQLPFVMVFNKTDVVSHKFATKWMNDDDLFERELIKDESYMSTLTKDLGRALYEFYRSIRTVGVSAATGEGSDDLFKAINEASKEWYESYIPALEKKKKAAAAAKAEKERLAVEEIKERMKLTKGRQIVYDHRGDKKEKRGGKDEKKKKKSSLQQPKNITTTKEEKK